MHLDHINGDHYDNRLENLQILCPNCHTQTPTYSRSSKRKKHRAITECTTEEIQAICMEATNVTEAALLLGVNPNSDSVRACIKRHLPLEKNVKQPTLQKRQLPRLPREYVPPFTAKELQELLRWHPLSDIGPMFSLTGNAIGRWVKKWNLVQPHIGYFYRKGVREKTIDGYVVKIPFPLNNGTHNSDG